MTSLQKRRLTGIGKADKSDIGDDIQLNFKPAGLALLSRQSSARRLIGGGFKMTISPAAVTAGQERNKPLSPVAEIVDKLIGIGIFNNAARRERNNTVSTFRTEPF